MKTVNVTIAGVTSPVCDSGPGTSEEAVVFVHGNPGSLHDWERLFEQVAPFSRAIAMDMPGFGRADKPADFRYDVYGYAQHLQGILDTLGVRRAHIVLHDFGGPWGLQWAAEHPEALASAILINTGVFLDYKWHFLARIWRTPKLGEISMAITTQFAWNQLLKIGNPRGIPTDAGNRLFANFGQDTRNAVLKLYRATNDPSGVGYAQCRVLKPLNRPALVLWGKHDIYLPYEKLAHRQREAFPEAEIVALDESGHFPFLDDPEATAAAIIPFLKKQVGAC